MTDPTPTAPRRVLLDAIDQPLFAARLRELRTRLDAAAGRSHGGPGPELLVASKYFAPALLPGLVGAGVRLFGENRAEALPEKQAATAGLPVQWDYIGELQSRKAAAIAPLVRRIHTLASASAVRKLQALQASGGAIPELLVQVNVAGEAGKGGVDPQALPALLEAAAGLPVRGLMTMPPLAAVPEDSRRWFAGLRELAAAHALPQLSMGTSQDALVAAEEGATVVRIGGVLHDDQAWERLIRSAG